MEECSICSESLEKDTFKIECGHVFHNKCIIGWFRKGHTECPLCRDGEVDKLEDNVSKLQISKVQDKVEPVVEEVSKEEIKEKAYKYCAAPNFVDGHICGKATFNTYCNVHSYIAKDLYCRTILKSGPRTGQYCAEPLRTATCYWHNSGDQSPEEQMCSLYSSHGISCSKYHEPGKKYCKIHANKGNPQCMARFKSGVKKGEQCNHSSVDGSVYCGKHKK